MSAPIDLVIVGAGGHGRQLLDLVDAHNRVADVQYRFLGFLDDGDDVDEALLARRGTSLLGPSSLLFDMDVAFAIGVALAEPRRRLDTALLEAGRVATSFAHPTAVVGSLMTAGHGMYLSAGSVIDTNVTVGRQFHINLNATVGHESVIGDYVTITPGARVSGNVTIGDDVFIGTNAVIIQGVTVGDRVLIGAGVTVRRDIPSDVVFTGHKPRLVETAGLSTHAPKGDVRPERLPSATVLGGVLPAS